MSGEILRADSLKPFKTSFHYITCRVSVPTSKRTNFVSTTKTSCIFMEVMGHCSENTKAENLLRHHASELLNITVTVTYSYHLYFNG